MKSTVFAFVVAALALAAVPASQAAPIAPLGSGVTTNNNVTQVWWHHHRHCWRGRYGHLHCHW
jgi:hypothetical protein